MPLEKSEAVILKMFNWSESSRTVVFFTRDFGKLPLVDKGGRSLKSKRGRLLRFARLEITFYSSQKESNGYISDCEMLKSYSLEAEGSLGRLAYASAACELLYLLLPERESHPSLYAYLLTFLQKVQDVDKHNLTAVFLTFFLRTMSQLGYHPSLAYCAGCGKEAEGFVLPGDRALFSPQRGGLVCPSCQKPGEYYIGLSADQVKTLSVLQRASLEEAATVPLGYQEATTLVEALGDFLKFHSGLVTDLKSLEFLEKLKNTQLT
jgi:DNA repair protein RecO (recombination protein O)